MKTIQEQYNLIKEGKGDKNFFMKSIRNSFPEHINQFTSYNDAIIILKNKSLISEIVVVNNNKEDWFAIFEAEIKSVEKETSKEVLDTQKHAFQPSDRKNIDNIYGQSFLNGYYAEMKDPENWEKSVDDLKDIVAKNMAKDINYYAKNAMFGEKGVGFVNDAPGLGATKEPKGKLKSSGYGDLEIKGDLDIDIKDAKKNVKDTLSGSEAKTSMPKKVKEMTIVPKTAKGVKKMDMPGKPKTIKLKEGLEVEDKITQIAPELEKMTGNEEDMYFNRRTDLTPEAKDELERAGYSVEFQDVQDSSEDETPWHVYKVCKIEGDNSLEEIILKEEKYKVAYWKEGKKDDEHFTRIDIIANSSKEAYNKAKEQGIEDDWFHEIHLNDGRLAWSDSSGREINSLKESRIRTIIKQIIKEELDKDKYTQTLFNIEKPYLSNKEDIENIIGIYKNHIQQLSSIQGKIK